MIQITAASVEEALAQLGYGDATIKDKAPIRIRFRDRFSLATGRHARQPGCIIECDAVWMVPRECETTEAALEALRELLETREQRNAQP